LVQDQSVGRSCAYAAAIVLIGQAIALGAERFSPVALALIALALVSVVLGICKWPRSAPRWLLLALVILAIGGGFLWISINDAFRRDPRSAPAIAPFVTLAAIAVVPIVVLLFGKSRGLRAAGFWLLVAIHFLMGIITITARVPRIDVYVIQTLGCEALTHGRNPFAITFENPYPSNAGFYPPAVLKDGQVQVGYFYPPLSLLLDLPGYLIGDVRYSHVAALTLAALLIAYMRPGAPAFVWAAMVMFAARIFYMLQVAWIEPFVALLLAATVFFAMRKRYTLAAVALGLFLVSKQYALFTIPVALLLIPRPWNWRTLARWAAIAFAAGAAVTFPFILWDVHAFFHSMTALYVGILRYDSISFLPPLARALDLKPSLSYPAIAAVPAIAFTLCKSPRTPAGFAVSTALILLAVFAFSAQSFGNYYFLVIAALCVGIAADVTDSPTSGVRVVSPSSPGEGRR
jgi:hypothetical protein